MNRSNVNSRTCRQPLIAANFPGRGIRCCCPGLQPEDGCQPTFPVMTEFDEDFTSLANWTPITVGNPAPAIAPAPEAGHPNAQSLASGAPVSLALLAFGPAMVDPSNPLSQPNFSVCWRLRQVLPADQSTGFVVGMVDPTLQDFVAIALDPGVSPTNLLLVWQSGGGPRTDVVTPFVMNGAWHAIHLERIGQGPFVLAVDGVRFVAPADLGPGVLPAQPLQVCFGALGIFAAADVLIDGFSLAF